MNPLTTTETTQASAPTLPFSSPAWLMSKIGLISVKRGQLTFDGTTLIFTDKAQRTVISNPVDTIVKADFRNVGWAIIKTQSQTYKISFRNPRVYLLTGYVFMYTKHNALEAYWESSRVAQQWQTALKPYVAIQGDAVTLDRRIDIAIYSILNLAILFAFIHLLLEKPAGPLYASIIAILIVLVTMNAITRVILRGYRKNLKG